MRVLVADDHPLVRDAYARVARLLDAEDPVQVVEAHSFEDIEHCCDLQTFDLAVVDLNMPDMDGMVGLRRLLRAYPSLPIVVASAQDDLRTIKEVMRLGVSGFCSKNDAQEEVLRALRAVLCGGFSVPAAARQLASQALCRPDEPRLTKRELDVLCALMQGGGSNRDLAKQLGVGEGTIRTHISRVLLVLGVKNRTEAILRARELGIRCPGQETKRHG